MKKLRALLGLHSVDQQSRTWGQAVMIAIGKLLAGILEMVAFCVGLVMVTCMLAVLVLFTAVAGMVVLPLGAALFLWAVLAMGWSPACRVFREGIVAELAKRKEKP